MAAEPFDLPRSYTDSSAQFEQTSSKQFLSPVNNDSTLQPKAVLTVVVVAGSQGTVVAKAGVEILSLDQA